MNSRERAGLALVVALALAGCAKDPATVGLLPPLSLDCTFYTVVVEDGAALVLVSGNTNPAPFEGLAAGVYTVTFPPGSLAVVAELSSPRDWSITHAGVAEPDVVVQWDGRRGRPYEVKVWSEDWGEVHTAEVVGTGEGQRYALRIPAAGGYRSRVMRTDTFRDGAYWPHAWRRSEAGSVPLPAERPVLLDFGPLRFTIADHHCR